MTVGVARSWTTPTCRGSLLCGSVAPVFATVTAVVATVFATVVAMGNDGGAADHCCCPTSTLTSG
jgi:hypothetical protein